MRQREKGNNLGFKDDTRFLGIINKADYLYQYKTLTVRPKIKSELLKDDTPYSMGGVRPVRDQWTGMLFLDSRIPRSAAHEHRDGYRTTLLQGFNG